MKALLRMTAIAALLGAQGWLAAGEGLSRPLPGFASLQRTLGARPTDSGRPLSPEQAAYDVLSYELDLAIDPERRSISGWLTMEARILFPAIALELDLDDPLQVEEVLWLQSPESRTPLNFERPPGKIRLAFPTTRQPGETVRIRIGYGGQPRSAPRPPWVGGFVWERTQDGQHWVGVACQLDGADLWWPCKDHPSDEPDRMDLRFTVPDSLTAVSNGRLQGVRDNADATRTFHWRVGNPINNYAVSVNVAPYRLIEEDYRSVDGSEFPLRLWLLPESYDQGPRLLQRMRLDLRFLEEKLGPYPFRNEKYGVVQTPYLGMEHQTVIAYGSDFTLNEYGFDWLHFHELAHEWWGNLVTAPDWRDFWVHEGFASYMEALYAESLQGPQGLRSFMAGMRGRIRNERPVGPRRSRSTREKYFVPPDYESTDGDINFKGAWILHTLRFVVGQEAFFSALRKLTYPQPAQGRSQGCQCHFKGTEDVQAAFESASGRSLDWFFEVYLRRAQLPRLEVRREDGFVQLAWTAPQSLPFPMPLEVGIDGRLRRIEMPAGKARTPLPDSASFEVDPSGWILRAADPE